MLTAIKYILTLSLCMFVVACATKPTIPENPPGTPLSPMEKPKFTTQRFYQVDMQNGEERYYDRQSITADGSSSGLSSDGCSWTGDDDMFSPAISWEGCGSNPEWSKGENRNITKKGDLWPLKVGNTSSYRFSQFNANGKDTGKKTRKCKVVSEVNIDVTSGNFDAYKVSCRRQSGDWWSTRVWYISPELNAEIKFVRRSSNRGVEADYELLRIEDI